MSRPVSRPDAEGRGVGRPAENRTFILSGYTAPMVQSAPFDISIEPSSNLLVLRVRGLWDDSIASSFIREQRQMRARLARLTGRTRAKVLVDAREQGCQPKQIVEALSAYLVETQQQTGRTATLVLGAVHKLQAARVCPGSNAGTFNEEAAARGWLSEEE